MTRADGLRVRWAWWQSRRLRGRLRVRPLLQPEPAGRLRLPGTRVETRLVEAADAYHRPCALVLVPETGHVSTVLEVALPGDDSAWTEDLGAWLALLRREPDLAGCAVVLQQPAQPHAQSEGSPGSPPGSPPGRRALIQLTWRLAALRDGDAAAAAVEVLARVPRLVQSLHHGAIGTARPLSAAEVAAVVRNAYGPTSPGPIPQPATRPGSAESPSPGSSWSQAGPVGPAESWHQFRHSGAASLTWSLGRVPPSVVLSTLRPSLGAVPANVARTRVTLLHDPGTDGAAPQLTSLVTLTSATDTADLPTAAEILLDTLPTPLRPWLRPRYGSQAAAFAAGLPTGTLLAAHAAPPGLLIGP